MSQLSKARDRMLSKKSQSSQPQDKQSAQKYPRKFTVSSLTARYQHKKVQEEEGTHLFIRSNTGWLRKLVQSPSQGRSIQEYGAKENTPLTRTIKLKINQISNATTPYYQPQQQHSQDSRYLPSPPRILHKKKLHPKPIQLIIAPSIPIRQHSPYKPRECSLQYTQQYISSSLSSGRSFIDSTFPPAPTMIFSRKLMYQQQGLKFQRLSRIYQNDITIVRSCQPTFISLGKYTNPYVYSAVCMLAQDPARVLGLFGNQEANQKGVYHVCLCKDGTWRYIILDDFVPVKTNNSKKQLLFLHSRQQDGIVQLWPALLQKAISKIYGTYLDVAMSRDMGMTPIFKMLTGAPVSKYALNKDFRSYLILIDSALKRGHIVTLQQVEESNLQAVEMRNMHGNMAYQIIQIKKSGVKLRNYAQAQLITKLPFEECLLFSRIVIYRLQPSYHYIAHKLRHKQQYYSKLSLTLSTPSRGYFQVWQNNPAYYKPHLNPNAQYKQAKYKIWLCGKDEQNGQWVQGGREVELGVGEYWVKVRVEMEREMDFTLSWYGEREIKMERVKNCQKWEDSGLA